MRIAAIFSFLRCFSSPSGHRWQYSQFSAFWQPLGFHIQAHGRHWPERCRAEPFDGTGPVTTGSWLPGLPVSGAGLSNPSESRPKTDSAIITAWASRCSEPYSLFWTWSGTSSKAVDTGPLPDCWTGTNTFASAFKNAAEDSVGGKAKLYAASVAFGVGVAAHNTFGVLASTPWPSPRGSSVPSCLDVFEAVGDGGEPDRTVVVRRLPGLASMCARHRGKRGWV